MRARILITGGGTGGHLFPALSIVPFLSPQDPAGSAARLNEASPSGAALPGARLRLASGQGQTDWIPMYVGSSRGLERTVLPKLGIPYHLFPMAAPRSLKGAWFLAAATARSLLTVLAKRPGVTFATGGYVSFPATFASWLLRVPVVLYLPDVVPGRAIAALAPLARSIATTVPPPAGTLKSSKVVVTGYPVRPAFAHASREAGRRRFGLPLDARVLIVFGASQGARSINNALAASFVDLLERAYILHICGPDRLPEAEAAAGRLTPHQRERYLLFPFLHEEAMADALAAADLAVCRSGASVLGELPAAGVPAVLVPLPNPRVHQRPNAEYLARAGAAVIAEDTVLRDTLPYLVRNLLEDDARLQSMATAMRALSRPDAAEAIARLVTEAAR